MSGETNDHARNAVTEEAAPPPPEPPREHTISGDVRLHEGFHSEHLDVDRTVAVYLPPGYDPKGAQRYPVLYLHDGQNVFDRATSVGDEWQVDENAQTLITSGQIEPLIVVGIYNTGEARIGEYTPTAMADKGGGNADAYGRMLVRDLKPFIDRTYKTLPAAPSTGLGGSSLGGLVTLYLGLRYPTVFGRLALLSPSVWWDDRFIIGQVEALASKTAQRIWLDAGAREGEEVVADAERLRDALVAKGWVLDEDLQFHVAEAGEHNERSWAERIGMVLRFLFPPAKGSTTRPEMSRRRRA